MDDGEASRRIAGLGLQGNEKRASSRAPRRTQVGGSYDQRSLDLRLVAGTQRVIIKGSKQDANVELFAST